MIEENFTNLYNNEREKYSSQVVPSMNLQNLELIVYLQKVNQNKLHSIDLSGLRFNNLEIEDWKQIEGYFRYFNYIEEISFSSIIKINSKNAV